MKIVHRGAIPSAIKIYQNNQKNLTLGSCRKREEKEERRSKGIKWEKWGNRQKRHKQERRNHPNFFLNQRLNIDLHIFHINAIDPIRLSIDVKKVKTECMYERNTKSEVVGLFMKSLIHIFPSQTLKKIIWIIKSHCASFSISLSTVIILEKSSSFSFRIEVSLSSSELNSSSREFFYFLNILLCSSCLSVSPSISRTIYRIEFSCYFLWFSCYWDIYRFGRIGVEFIFNLDFVIITRIICRIFYFSCQL